VSPSTLDDGRIDGTRSTHGHALEAGAFRSDINGLRAWAVVAVALYHYGVPGFGGGFVGVDVFFVISGYLMTGIVVAQLERDASISLVSRFYMARARRIVPALVTLCAVLLILGWWLVLPLDYLSLSANAASSLLFVSNFKYWREADYFRAASHENWLLHTWSLSVEWQFYLLLPIALWAIWRWRPGRKTVGIALAVALVGSLALSVLGTLMRPTAAFYLLPTRAWELLAGGLVHQCRGRWTLSPAQRAALEALGLALVIAAVLGFDSRSSWPGWRACVPVFATMLILLCARTESRWTGHAIAQWIGTRSYSIYLWHWPLAVALSYAGWKSNAWAVCASVAVTMLLGHLSYSLVESGARTRLNRMQPMLAACALLAATVLPLVASVLVIRGDGVSGRFPAAIEAISHESLNRNPRQGECFASHGAQSPSCVYGGPHIRAIVLGDSHADAIVSAVAAALPRPEDGVMEWSYSGCPTVRGARSTRESAYWKCAEFMDWALNALERVPRDVPVVVVNRHALYARGENEDPGRADTPWIYFTSRYGRANAASLTEYALRLTETACELARNRTVYLVRPIPELGTSVPNTARASAWGRKEEVSIPLSQYRERNVFALKAQDAAHDRCGVKLLDPLPYLCHDGRCDGTQAGRPIYFDDNHLSEYGNKLLVPMFAEIFTARAD